MTGLPDWRLDAAYAPLVSMPRWAFAWEWIRRDRAYRSAWLNSARAPADAARFGLEAFEDPSLDAFAARPIWSRAIDRSVLVADVVDGDAPAEEMIDLLAFRQHVSLVVDRFEREHVLLSNGRRALRIDVVRGSLIGGPALLAYQLSGLRRAAPRLSTLEHLIALAQTGRFADGPAKAERRARRWVMELRVADALAAGASQQEIARVLFGAAIATSRWRLQSGAYRLRIQRLVRAVRNQSRLAQPSHWFGGRERGG